MSISFLLNYFLQLSGLSKGWALGQIVRMILHTWFNHIEEGFSCKQVVFKTLASLPQSAEKVNKTPEL